MPNAAYYRRQAKLYRELARHLSDRRDAETALAASDRARRRAEKQLPEADGVTPTRKRRSV
jgi:hypothetical protein